MPNPADQCQLIHLEALPRPAAVAKPTPRQLGLNVLDGERQTGGKTLDDDDKRLPVRFAGSQVTKHSWQATGALLTARGQFPLRCIHHYRNVRHETVPQLLLQCGLVHKHP